MKKFLNICMGLMMACMTLGLVGCEDPEGGGNSGGNVTQNDLLGSWLIEMTDFSMEWTFDEEGMATSVYSYQGIAEEPERVPYTVEDGNLILTYDEWESWYTLDIVGDGNVLIMKYYVPDSLVPYEQKSDDFEMFYRKGAKIAVDKKALEGEWLWYMHGNDSIVRTALVVKDQSFDLIIPIWREYYKCGFKYENGYLVGDISGFAVRSYADESVENLYKDWDFDFQDPEYYSAFTDLVRIPFYPVGDKAYSSVANLPCIFEKR